MGKERKYLMYPVEKVLSDVAVEVELGNVTALAISYKDKNGKCHSCISTMGESDLYDLGDLLKYRAYKMF